MDSVSVLFTLLYIVIVIVLLPLVLAWTGLGIVLTTSPAVCSTLTVLLITLLFLFSEFFNRSNFLFIEYILFLPIIIFSFQYRIYTKKFRYLSSVFLFVLSLGLSILVVLTSSNIGNRVVSFLTLVAIGNVSVVSLNLWIPASQTALLKAEEAYVKCKCDRKVVHLMVAGLGTIKVLDDYVEDEDVEEEVSIVGSSSAEGGFGHVDKKKATHRPVLVLVHGYGGCNGDFAGTLSVLQQRFKVFCVEMYGFGRSVAKDKSEKWRARTIDQCFRLMCTALEEWRKTMKIESFVLLGHSLGTHIVSAYAMGYPTRVEHLILASPIGVGIPDHRRKSAGRQSFERGENASSWGGMDRVWDMVWEWGYTPQDILRWTGPIGPFIIRRLLDRRELLLIEQMYHSSLERRNMTQPDEENSTEENRQSLNNQVSLVPPPSSIRSPSFVPEDSLAAAELTYQQLARRPFGARCLKVFLHRSGVAKRPLITWLGTGEARMSHAERQREWSRQYQYQAQLQKTLLSSPSPTSSSSVSCRPLSESSLLLCHENEKDSRAGARTRDIQRESYDDFNVLRGIDGKKTKVSLIYGTRGIDIAAAPVGSQYDDGQELVTALQLEGIFAARYEVSNAGHLAHVDNPQEFALTVIQSHFAHRMTTRRL